MINIDIKLEGVGNVMKALRRYKNKTAIRFQKALGAAAEYLHQKSGEIVPIDKGDLWKTSLVRREGEGLKTQMIVAYTAPYAVFVHEDLNASHGAAFNVKHIALIVAGLTHARRPGEQAKFLEKPCRDPLVQDGMRALIRQEMERP